MNPLLKNSILRKIIRFFRPADTNDNAVTEMYSRFEAIAEEQALEQKEYEAKAKKIQAKATHAKVEKARADLAVKNIHATLTKED